MSRKSHALCPFIVFVFLLIFNQVQIKVYFWFGLELPLERIAVNLCVRVCVCESERARLCEAAEQTTSTPLSDSNCIEKLANLELFMVCICARVENSTHNILSQVPTFDVRAPLRAFRIYKVYISIDTLFPKCRLTCVF